MNVKFLKHTFFSGKITSNSIDGLKKNMESWFNFVKELGYLEP